MIIGSCDRLSLLLCVPFEARAGLTGEPDLSRPARSTPLLDPLRHSFPSDTPPRSICSTTSTFTSVLAGPGWSAENGTGKTTLLRLAAGELRPSSGRVLLDPPGGRVMSCPQTVEDLTDQVEEFARSWDGFDAALRNRLGLDPVDLERWETLSPGERKRWQVGAALVAAPDVLLVDEPTNHLDSDTRQVLGSRFGWVRRRRDGCLPRPRSCSTLFAVGFSGSKRTGSGCGAGTTRWRGAPGRPRRTDNAPSSKRCGPKARGWSVN